MTGLTAFIVASGGLSLAIIFYLVYSVQRKTGVSDHRSALNAAVYRDQLQELAAERDEGSLVGGDYDQAREEVERRLLEDTTVDPEVTDRTRGKALALTLLGGLPLLAIGFYLWRGHPEAIGWQNSPTVEAGVMTPGAMTPDKINAMIVKLADKLAKDPNNPQGWAMLGRSYMNTDRPSEAVKAFAHVKKEMEQDPGLMVDYAEALAAEAQAHNDDREMTESNDWVQKALKLEPGNGKGLFMEGSFALVTQQYDKARAAWEKLMPLLEPGSQDFNFVLEQLNKVRAMLKLPPVSGDAFVGPEGPVKAKGKSAVTSSVSGEVTLDPALADKVTPGETVFIFAKAVQGPPMPVAVIKTAVSTWPLHFELTDAMAMSPQFNLSSMDLVRIEVRISRSGNPMPSSGDLSGASLPLKPGSKGVKLVISQVLP